MKQYPQMHNSHQKHSKLEQRALALLCTTMLLYQQNEQEGEKSLWLKETAGLWIFLKLQFACSSDSASFA